MRSSKGLLPAALVVVLAGAVTGCSSEPETAPSPTAASPSPTASPSPSPPAPVDGTVELEVVDVAPVEGAVVPPGGGGVAVPAVDERRARRFAGNLKTWLDEHLTALQGGDDRGKLPGGRRLQGATSAVRAATTALADPDAPVAEATYHIRVAARGGPEWAQARVVVVDRDGSRHVADLMFVPSRRGPRVLAAGPRRNDR